MFAENEQLMRERLVSKVLVLDNAPRHQASIKQFCDAHALVPLTVRKNRLLSVLRSNIDLGAIFYAEDYGASREENAEIARCIHTLRPELPIILRRERSATLADIPDSLRRVFCAAYTADDMSVLRPVLDEYIFSLAYPNALVRGISEITETVLAGQFRQMTLRWDTPYLVRDRVIFGEVFSLIPLESAWCRGYMMLQAEERPLLAALGDNEGRDFRAVNNVLGELTNLIWGAFKNRYVGDAGGVAGGRTQVPLIVNHPHKYISFGTENPQLCFLYTLTDENTGNTVRLHQRFVFNLSWSPEDFMEITHASTELVESGELELF